MTLFVPNGTRGIVSLRDGSVQMERILVPVDHRPQPQSAVEYARRAARLRQGEPVEIVVLHVGDGSNRPELDYPDEPGVDVDELGEGGFVETIAGTAEELIVDLVVRATEGKQGILDAVRHGHGAGAPRCPVSSTRGADGLTRPEQPLVVETRVPERASLRVAGSAMDLYPVTYTRDKQHVAGLESDRRLAGDAPAARGAARDTAPQRGSVRTFAASQASASSRRRKTRVSNRSAT
jgi:hypothetical protein